MRSFISNNLTRRQKLALYRFLFTLNEMDFSYLRPVFAGALLFCLYMAKHLIPESYFLSVSHTQIALYYTVLVFTGVCFLIWLRPHVRRLIAKFRVYLYRRKKRATRSLFY